MPSSSPRRAAKAAPKKSEETRAKLLTQALRLFRRRGVDGTTMRDIAKATGLSLGAAYYYFPSKEALLFAYYDANQADAEARLAAVGPQPDLRARLGALFHGKLESVLPDRKMLAAIVHRLVDPRDPVSAFSAESRAVRIRSTAMFAAALEDQPLTPDTRRLVAQALWLAQMATLLYLVNDDSEAQARTRRLIDDMLDLFTPLVALAGSPFAAPIVERLRGTLDRAGLIDPIDTPATT
jgi:AcrR family transcriptional regulator